MSQERFLALACAVVLFRCTSDEPRARGPAADGAVTGGGAGASASGGTAAMGSGGAVSTSGGGGATAGSTSSGGASSGGGTSSGGTASGGSGGATGGGASTGGSASGGAGNGGASSGGASSGTGGAPATDGPRRAACQGASTGGDPLPATRTATPVRDGFGFIEGPVWVAAKNTLYFSDMNFSGGNAAGPPSHIDAMSLASGSPVFAVFVPASGSNGLALAADGRLLAATHDTQSLSYFATDGGTRTAWPLTAGGKHFNSPNDLVIRSDGNVYFTDPNYQLGNRTSETGVEGLYRVARDGSVTLVDAAFDKVNGVTLSPDENTLYAAGASGGIAAFSLDAAGTPSGRRRFAAGSSDGMTVDCAGNVYSTQGDVVVHSPAGTELGRITVPGPSNVAFGGEGRRTLYITAGNTLYSIRMNVPGMPY